MWLYSFFRWLGVVLNFFGALLVFVAALLMVSLRDSLTPGQVGLAMAYAAEVSMHLLKHFSISFKFTSISS